MLTMCWTLLKIYLFILPNKVSNLLEFSQNPYSLSYFRSIKNAEKQFSGVS